MIETSRTTNGLLVPKRGIVTALSEVAFGAWPHRDLKERLSDPSPKVADRLVDTLEGEGFGDVDAIVIESFDLQRDPANPRERSDNLAHLTCRALAAQYAERKPSIPIIGRQGVSVEHTELLLKHLEARVRDFDLSGTDLSLPRDKQNPSLAYVAVLGTGRLTPEFNFVSGDVPLTYATHKEYAKEMSKMRPETMRDGGIAVFKDGQLQRVTYGNVSPDIIGRLVKDQAQAEAEAEAQAKDQDEADSQPR